MKKRQRKKSLTKQQRALLKGQGLKQKDIKKLSSKQLENITKPIIQEQEKQKQRQKYIKFWESEPVKKEQTRIYKKAQRMDLHRKKVLALEEMGFDRAYLPESLTRKIKLDDIKKKNITMENYPDVFEVMQLNDKQRYFNYKKVYKIPGGKAFYFAYCDYTANSDFEVLINRNSKKSPKELLQGIIRLLNTPPGPDKSTGKAGGYKYSCAEPETIEIFHKAKNRENKEMFERKSRVHTDRLYNGYQTLADRDHARNYFTEISGKGALTIAYTIMDNVTEFERFVFYERFYSDLVKSIPEFKEILPLPKRY